MDNFFYLFDFIQIPTPMGIRIFHSARLLNFIFNEENFMVHSGNTITTQRWNIISPICCLATELMYELQRFFDGNYSHKTENTSKTTILKILKINLFNFLCKTVNALFKFKEKMTSQINKIALFNQNSDVNYWIYLKR